MAGIIGSIVSFTEQKFSTLPASIVGQGVALWALSIRYPGAAAAAVPGATYLFPISPQAIRAEPTALNTLYDTQGPSSTLGVLRQADMWGESPPIITLRGTQGFKRHSSDGFLLTGKQSLAALQALLAQFAQLNQELMAKNAQQFYTLELLDYWNNSFWSVVPIGPIVFDQSADRPIIGAYTLRLAAIASVASPIPVWAVDALVIAFGAGAQQLQLANSFLTTKLAAY
jgi:hypothetical protein